MYTRGSAAAFRVMWDVNRITIRTNKFGQPKGYAYEEFIETNAVEQALLLNESELHGRHLKVSAKRTNVPGMKQFRPQRSNPYMGYRSRTHSCLLLSYIPIMDMGTTVGRFRGLGCQCDTARTSDPQFFA